MILNPCAKCKSTNVELYSFWDTCDEVIHCNRCGHEARVRIKGRNCREQKQAIKEVVDIWNGEMDMGYVEGLTFSNESDMALVEFEDRKIRIIMNGKETQINLSDYQLAKIEEWARESAE